MPFTTTVLQPNGSIENIQVDTSVGDNDKFNPQLTDLPSARLIGPTAHDL